MKSIGMAITVGLTALTSAAACAADPILGIAASGHTADWNPINTRSYPALLVSRWIGERLYERKCRSRKGEIKELKVLCQDEREEAREGGRVRLSLAARHCGQALGLPPLSAADVQYTLEQIHKATYSEYRHYDIRLTPAGILQLGGGDQGVGLAQLHKFDFPILRRVGPESDGLFDRRIDVGDVDDLNRHTGGPYQVAGIGPNHILLKARPGADATLVGIRITELALDLEQQDFLNRPDKPPVVLAVPIDFPYPQGTYQASHSEDLANVTYIGFNFAHPDFRRPNPPRQHDLIESDEFRELFTRSLWSIGVVRDKVGIGQYNKGAPGVFLGESFDLVTGNLPDLDPPLEMGNKIQSFLREQRLNKPLELRILISPEVYKHFTPAEVEGLIGDLESLWSPKGVNGLRFKEDKRDTAAEFASARDQGQYHLVFDDLLYGRNVRRQVAFVDPRNRAGENFLGIDAFGTDQIDAWLNDPINGMVEFRKAVAKRFPLAVVGQFPRADLFANQVIDKGQVDCGSAQPLPFFDVAHWRLR